MRTVRLRLRAGPPVRPVHRLLLGRHPSADLPHAEIDGGRRLGARHARRATGQAGQEGLHRLRRRTVPRWPAGSPNRCRAAAARWPTTAPATSRSRSAAPRTATSTRCALRWPRFGPSAPNCWTPTADSRSGSFPIRARLSGSALHQYLVLRGGIRAEESAIDWLDEVAATAWKSRGHE